MTVPSLDTTVLVGRRQETADVLQLLTTARLVTLTGVAGAGKSSLARRVTAELAAAHSGRVWLVDLGDVGRPGQVGDAIALALGLRLPAEGWQPERFAEMAGSEPAWLTLDNCEHLLGELPDLVSGLLALLPNLRVLATSRQRLDLPWEGVYAVPALPVEDALALFEARAATLLPGFAVAEDNRETLTRLVEDLECLPHPIELAAARIRALAPQTMLERLTDRYALLNRAPHGAPERQRSLEASVAWSHSLCTPQEQLLWARLSVFAGMFSLEAAEAVCAGDGIAAVEVLDLLSDLIDRSLVIRVPDDQHTYYRMLETIRQFGARRLADSGTAADVRARHRAWFVELAQTCGRDWVGPRQNDWVLRLRTQHRDLVSAIAEAAADPVEAPGALRAVFALRNYWVTQGLLTEARRLLDQALLHGTGSTEERALGLFLGCYFATVQRDLPQAESLHAALDALLVDTDRARLRGYRLYASAGLAAFSGDLAEGLDLGARMVEAFRDAGDVVELVTAEGTLALWLSYDGQVPRAVELLEHGLSVMRPLGDAYFSSYALWVLGNLALAAERTTEAARLQREALALKWDLRDDLGIAMVLEGLAAACVRDEALLAVHMLGAADSIWRRVGTRVRDEPHMTAQREATRATARRVLDETTCQEGFDLGGRLPLAKVVAFALGQRTPPAVQAPVKSSLTAREEEVAALLGEGLTNQEIADRLVISLRTAQGHVENILRKLGFSSRTQVATWVVRQGGPHPAGASSLETARDS